MTVKFFLVRSEICKTGEIEVATGIKISALLLGERGRGRHLAVIPYTGELRNGAVVKPGLTRSGQPRLDVVDGVASETDILVAVSVGTVYTRHASGGIYHREGDGITRISRGFGASGDAGRLGTYESGLYRVPEGSYLRIRRAGGSKTSPFYVVNVGGEIRIIEDDAAAVAFDALGMDFLVADNAVF